MAQFGAIFGATARGGLAMYSRGVLPAAERHYKKSGSRQSRSEATSPCLSTHTRVLGPPWLSPKRNTQVKDNGQKKSGKTKKHPPLSGKLSSSSGDVSQDYDEEMRHLAQRNDRHCRRRSAVYYPQGAKIFEVLYDTLGTTLAADDEDFDRNIPLECIQLRAYCLNIEREHDPR